MKNIIQELHIMLAPYNKEGVVFLPNADKKVKELLEFAQESNQIDSFNFFKQPIELNMEIINFAMMDGSEVLEGQIFMQK